MTEDERPQAPRLLSLRERQAHYAMLVALGNGNLMSQDEVTRRLDRIESMPYIVEGVL